MASSSPVDRPNKSPLLDLRYPLIRSLCLIRCIVSTSLIFQARFYYRIEKNKADFREPLPVQPTSVRHFSGVICKAQDTAIQMICPCPRLSTAPIHTLHLAFKVRRVGLCRWANPHSWVERNILRYGSFISLHYSNRS